MLVKQFGKEKRRYKHVSLVLVTVLPCHSFGHGFRS